MSVDLPALLDRFSVAADTRPTHALQLWTSIVAHRDWPATALEVRRAALDDLAAARSAVGDHDGAVATAEAALAPPHGRIPITPTDSAVWRCALKRGTGRREHQPTSNASSSSAARPSTAPVRTPRNWWCDWLRRRRSSDPVTLHRGVQFS